MCVFKNRGQWKNKINQSNKSVPKADVGQLHHVMQELVVQTSSLPSVCETKPTSTRSALTEGTKDDLEHGSEK